MPAKIRFSQAVLDSLRLSYESGVSTVRLARDHQVSAATILRALRRMGVAIDAGRSLSTSTKGRPSHRKGATHTPETRAKMSADRKGKRGTRFGPPSDETRARISAGTRGKNVKHTPEEKRVLEKVRSAAKRFVRRTLKASGKRKSIPSAAYNGYTTAQLVAHLGPRPENSHIDHYVPVTEFVRRGIHDPAAINALLNLRWLDGKENQRKSGRVPPDADDVVDSCLRAAAWRRVHMDFAGTGEKNTRKTLTAHFAHGIATYSEGVK